MNRNRKCLKKCLVHQILNQKWVTLNQEADLAAVQEADQGAGPIHIASQEVGLAVAREVGQDPRASQ